MSAPPQSGRLTLRAGPLTMVFEPQTAFLRYIRLGDQEVLRGIYVAVRDRNWNTIPLRLDTLRPHVTADTFDLVFEATAQAHAIHYTWQGRLTGTAAGTVRFAMDGVARSTFWRNRIGFCVLHPPSCAGQPCLLDKADGTQEHGVFPTHIAPHQPFDELRAMTHTIIPGTRARIAFEGDIFETEDQRNWTDASFKTYSTPLRIPIPVEVEAGTRIHQAVTIALETPLTLEAPGEVDPAVTLALPATDPVPLPAIGLGSASHGQPLTTQAVTRLHALCLGHLRLDVSLDDPNYATHFARGAEEASRLGTPLEVALLGRGPMADALKDLQSVVAQIQPPVARWLILHENGPSASALWVEKARAMLGAYTPEARFGAGTNAFFTAFNRDRPDPAGLQVVGYSVNPQCHAFDEATLVETLEGQAATVRTAQQIVPGVDVAVTPITLKARFNPDASGPEPSPPAGTLPTPVDARQPTLFAAGWTLGSIAYLAHAGATSITYYETTGWRGVMERSEGTPLPEQFPSVPGGVFPLYHVLRDVGAYAGGQVHAVTSSDPLRVTAMILSQGTQRCLLMANHTNEPQRIHLALPDKTRVTRVRVLDAASRDEAMRDPETFQATWAIPAGEEVSMVVTPYAYVHAVLTPAG